MKPIEHAFVESILESPDDDAPRLIYADWLEENDQPERAEFIRVQCETARTRCTSEPRCDLLNEGLPEEAQGYCLECCRMDALHRRERELFFSDPHSFQPIPDNMQMYESLDPPSVTMHGIHYTFRRGFVEEITISLAEWLQHGQALVKAAPLRVVRLSDMQPMQALGTWLYPDSLFSMPSNSFYDAASELFRTEADALAAMSRCCLEYARARNTKIVPT